MSMFKIFKKRKKYKTAISGDSEKGMYKFKKATFSDIITFT